MTKIEEIERLRELIQYINNDEEMKEIYECLDELERQFPTESIGYVKKDYISYDSSTASSGQAVSTAPTAWRITNDGEGSDDGE